MINRTNISAPSQGLLHSLAPSSGVKTTKWVLHQKATVNSFCCRYHGDESGTNAWKYKFS